MTMSFLKMRQGVLRKKAKALYSLGNFGGEE